MGCDIFFLLSCFFPLTDRNRPVITESSQQGKRNMAATKTVFTSNGTKIQIDEVAFVVTITSPDGDIVEAGYFDTIDTSDGPKTASLYALETLARRTA